MVDWGNPWVFVPSDGKVYAAPFGQNFIGRESGASSWYGGTARSCVFGYAFETLKENIQAIATVKFDHMGIPFFENWDPQPGVVA